MVRANKLVETRDFMGLDTEELSAFYPKEAGITRGEINEQDQRQ
jgi:hypothetical protein